jgi:hypothetical protein
MINSISSCFILHNSLHYLRYVENYVKIKKQYLIFYNEKSTHEDLFMNSGGLNESVLIQNLN